MRTSLRSLLLFFVLAACRKTDQVIDPAPNTTTSISSRGVVQSCDFGIRQFNTVKRPPLNDPIRVPEASFPEPSQAVLLLDFDGHTVRNTSWNYNGDIVCSPANLSSAGIEEVMRRVSEDFSPFEITVTTNESVYNQCDPARRMRVIITETWEWYCQAGGVSFIGSFTWGDNTPCFVFSVLLNYNLKRIAEAVSHEAGHTLGLYHQAHFNASCFLISEYHSGLGSGELSWAPIMGLGYYRNVTTWRRGSNIYGCNTIQDDISIITSVLGPREDDHPNIWGNPTPVNANYAEGCIENPQDVDFFCVNLTTASSILVAPFNVGMNNEGANTDLLIRIYGRNRSLISTWNDPNSLSVTTGLAPGFYLISVETVENSNAGRYGQLGNYSITVLPGS